MKRSVPAMEVIPAIRRMIEQLDAAARTDLSSGRRAALWRAQQHAAKLDNSIDDLRRYCLESLSVRRMEDESDYPRGYREGFQAVLRELRRFEPSNAPEPGSAGL